MRNKNSDFDETKFFDFDRFDDDDPYERGFADKLYDDYLEIYTQLLELLDKQYEQYDKILKADRMLRKKFNFIKCRYKKFSSFANENPKRRY